MHLSYIFSANVLNKELLHFTFLFDPCFPAFFTTIALKSYLLTTDIDFLITCISNEVNTGKTLYILQL